MSELNREQIIKALECCASEEYICTQCPIEEKIKDDCECGKVVARNALALITSQEQKIFKLENRLKECENGYEGTLFLDRCKLHDAEEKVKELTEESQKWQEAYDCADAARRELSSKCDELTEENEAWQKELVRQKEIANKHYYDLACEVEDLRSENERLKGVGIPDDETYIKLSDAKHAIMAYIGEQTVSKYASSEECKAARDGAEGAMNELDYLIPAKVAPIADTVRKMQERLHKRFKSDRNAIYVGYNIHRYIDQIAKEMLEEG